MQTYILLNKQQAIKHADNLIMLIKTLIYLLFCNFVQITFFIAGTIATHTSKLF